MKKLITILMAFSLSFVLFAQSSHANGMDVYYVKKGDSMWKISVKYQIGLSEIIGANPQVKNPAMIYPNQKLNIPNIDSIKQFEEKVVELTNQERTKNGLPHLTINWEASRVARYKSNEMRDKQYFSHQSPTYGSPFDMLKQFGVSYKSAGENIAKGQQTPQAVVQAWMNSSGHRANILNGNFTEIGVGYAKQGDIWTQMFIGK